MTDVDTDGARAHDAGDEAPRGSGPVAPTAGARITLAPVGCGAVAITGGFWAERQRRNRTASVPAGRRRLREAGNLDNLRLAREPGDHRDRYRGPVFMDSDIYKWLEALAWEIGRTGDAALREDLAEWTGELRATQEPDGYLNSWVQAAGDPARRYAQLHMSHELYCFGHLIQAAVAAHRAAGDDGLLGVARRAADHLVATFGPTDNPGLEGHPVVEMALVELYRETGERAYLELAETFVRRRGGGTVEGSGRLPIYFSDRVPAERADHLEGHAVRALYFASGVADVAAEIDPESAAGLDAAQRRQWEDLVARRTYITGGMGSRWDGEAFGDAYELPVDRAYCETCAAIGAMQWSWRRLLATGEPRHADLIERILYNGFASGTSDTGEEFFYVNALRVRDGAVPDDHRNPAAGRHGWYDVACCPPNVMRTLAQLSGYLATATSGAVQLQQYAPATVRTGATAFTVSTDYPWDGRVEVTIDEADGGEWSLDLRIPAWCERSRATVHASAGTSGSADGGEPLAGRAGEYLRLTRPWAVGDRVVLELDMPPRLTRADPRIDAVRGCVALEVGPLVYCVEDHDQPDGVSVDDVVLRGEATEARWRPDLLGGVAVVQLDGAVVGGGHPGLPYEPSVPVADAPPSAPVGLVAVPYHAWANRGVSGMRVWLPLAAGAERS